MYIGMCYCGVVLSTNTNRLPFCPVNDESTTMCFNMPHFEYVTCLEAFLGSQATPADVA